MKKILFLIMLVALFVGCMTAQDTNPRRAVLFTPGPDEVVLLDQYFVLIQVDQTRFACVVRDTVKNTQTLVFNGKRVVTGAGEQHDMSVYYSNIYEDDGYAVSYSWQGAGYANARGTVRGPFDEHSARFAWRFDTEIDWEVTDPDRFYYRVTVGGRREYHVYRRGADEGPFDGVIFPKTNSRWADREYLYARNGKWYARDRDGRDELTPLAHGEAREQNGKWLMRLNGIDGKERDEIDWYYLRFTESGHHAYKYKENGKWHVIVDGRESRGYDEIEGSDLLLTGSGHHAYKYRENGKWHVAVDGREDRGHDEIDALFLTESGHHVYKYKENGKWHVNVDGRESKAYDAVSIPCLTESGHHAYVFRENEKLCVNVDDRESRAYRSAWHLILEETGNYRFYYADNEDDIFENVNGRDTGLTPPPEKGFYCPPLNAPSYSTDGKHVLQSSFEENCVLIDGKRYGNAPAFYEGFDKTKNAFVWNAIENGALVAYEYRL
jgi:hypothetical protein